MSEPQILIISKECAAYAALLADLPVTPVADVEEARRAYAGQRVVLGEPDLVAAALPAMQAVRWVQSTWAGVRPLLDAAGAGLVVTGVKGVFGPQMAEYAIAYMLAREIDVLGRYASQQARAWDTRDTGRLAGRTLGVMGTGSIGAHIAARAGELGMRVHGFSRSGRPASAFQAVYGAERLPAFLAGLDYLVATLPDTPETDGLLGAEAFRTVPDHCCLINIGRGNVIDEAALVEALREGSLGAAVLDVFQQEPLPAGHPFWDAPNLLLTAHVAARSYPEDIAGIFRANYQRYLRGESLNDVVDAARGY